MVLIFYEISYLHTFRNFSRTLKIVKAESLFRVTFNDANIICVYTIMAINSGSFSFAGLNVFDSDASRINSAQPPGVQPPAVRPLGGHGTHDHQPIGAAQNQAMPLFRILVSGHVAEQRWQAEKTGGICR